MGNFYICGKSGHMKRDFPMLKDKVNKSSQSHESGTNSYSCKKKRFYSLQSPGDKKSSTLVVTFMLQVFSIKVYALFDPMETLSFINSLVSINFICFSMS